MNPLRRAVHAVMALSTLDRHVDADALNARFERRRAARHPVLSPECTSAWIAAALAAGRPAAIAKLGSSECWTLA